MAKTKPPSRLPEMFSLVEQWLQSNQTKKTFCQQNAINLYTFDYWLQKFKNQTPQPQFIKINSPQTQTISQSIRINYPSGVNIELPMATDLTVIGLLLKL